MQKLILFIFAISIGCGDSDENTANTEEIGEAAESLNNDCEQVEPLPDAPAASGQLTFNVSDDIDSCKVFGYVVGYNELLKLNRSEDGTFFIDNVPDGEHDVIVTAGSISAALREKDLDRGIRFKKLKFLNGVRTEKGQIDLPKMGSLLGTVTLNEQSDHAGIDVYIPGTEYLAKTDVNGQYSFSAIPVGEHNLYFEKDGYHRGQIEAIDVMEEDATEVPDISLSLSTGAEGFIIIENAIDAVAYRSVSIRIGATSDAVLMKLSESSTFDNTSWLPVITSTDYEFDSDGEKTLYVKFANTNGLESSPFSDTIIVDTAVPEFTADLSYQIRDESISVTIDANDTVGASEIKISSEADFDLTEWQEYSAQLSIPYSKTVNIQLRDALNHESVIETYTIPAYTLSLANARTKLTSATVGSMVLFAGGHTYEDGQYTYFNTVDIYNAETTVWSTASLSQARSRLTSSMVGNKVLFAGGWSESGYSSIVDIYDADSNTWSTANLSQARGDLTSATVGNKVLFAGGVYGSGQSSDVVDIYDASTNTWSTANLSRTGYMLSSSALGTQVFFAGGVNSADRSNVVDVYQSSTNSWSTATLSEARGYTIGMAAVGTQILFAGGTTAPLHLASSVVDIYDSSSDAWTTSTLPQAFTDSIASTVGSEVLFASNSGYIATYDSETMTWASTNLSQGRVGATSSTVGSKVIFAGGMSNNPSQYLDSVEIYDSETGTWTTEQ